MSLGVDLAVFGLAVADLQTKITEFLALDRICPVFWSKQGKGQALVFPPLSSQPWLTQCRRAGWHWKEQSITFLFFGQGGTGRAMARAIQKGK